MSSGSKYVTSEEAFKMARDSYIQGQKDFILLLQSTINTVTMSHDSLKNSKLPERTQQ